MGEPLLDIRNLRKSYGAVQATTDVSFSVEQGHVHALIGPNGAGKTTLVNQLAGDILPDSGSICYQSRDITRLPAFKRARLGIARSFQITHIFENLTVAENMVLAINANRGHNFRFFRKAAAAQEVNRLLPQALQRVDLAQRSELKASNLSHGEKRQLEVGMALVGRPQLLILDEPMAGMGPGGTVELSNLIASLKGKHTILLVEHDMDVVFALADRVTVLVYGEHILTGDPATVRADKKVQQAYLGEGHHVEG